MVAFVRATLGFEQEFMRQGPQLSFAPAAFLDRRANCL